MNKPRTTRAASLAANAAWSRDGLYQTATKAAGARTVVDLLRDIYRNGVRTHDEDAFVRELAAAVANGDDVATKLRIERPKVGHRKADPLNRDITQMVDALLADGAGKLAAYRDTGAMVGMDAEAVRKAYAKGKSVENDTRQRMLEIERALAKARKAEKR